MNYKPATFHSKLFVYRVIHMTTVTTSWKPINPSAPDGVSGVHLAMAAGIQGRCTASKMTMVILLVAI